MGRFSSSALKAFLKEGGTRLIAGDGGQIHHFLRQAISLDMGVVAPAFRHQPPLLNPLLRR